MKELPLFASRFERYSRFAISRDSLEPILNVDVQVAVTEEANLGSLNTRFKEET